MSKPKVHFTSIRLRVNAGISVPECKAHAPLLDTASSRLLMSGTKGEVTCTRCLSLIGELVGYDGRAYRVGDRVELSPHLDLWMRGAKFGTVHSISLTPKDRVKVRSEHPQVSNLIAGTADCFRKA